MRNGIIAYGETVAKAVRSTPSTTTEATAPIARTLKVADLTA
jgi:hypothetical protein